MWRKMLRRLMPTPRRSAAVPVLAEADIWASMGRIATDTSEVLAQIEQTALDVYLAHGMPIKPGHYRRGHRARGWTFIAEHMTPEARWAAIQERPPEDGWRYGTLADIGRTGLPEVKAAAALLAGCSRLKDRLAGQGDGDPIADMEQAVRLGADWRSLESGRVRAGGARLRLTVPDDAVPVPVVVTLPGPKRRQKKVR